jgi:hypothetical protein
MPHVGLYTAKLRIRIYTAILHSRHTILMTILGCEEITDVGTFLAFDK